ncbi:MAG: hypothetical protein J6Y04_05955 [Bacteroidaceae bacterium]|nr:hypothetical protein [Bacteroidaceae bacterium]
MKKLFTFIAVICLALNASAQYQVENSDFEKWTASSGEPDHWHGFKSAKGGFAYMAQGKLASSTDVRPGTTGTKSALITSGSVLGIINNGTFTTGQLAAANMSAANTANNAQMDKSSSATDNNGEKFYMPLSGHPDAVKVWIKFSQGSTNADHPYASANAVIFDGSYYQDPEDKTYTNKVAMAKNNRITVCGWTELTIPFDYESYKDNVGVTNYNNAGGAILVTFGTNADPGQGSNGDKVWVDDMELLYYSELASATYNGNAISFNGTSATVNEYYDASKLNITSNGHGAKVETSMDESKQLLTVTIKGDNISEDANNFHTYTIQFKQYGYDLLSLAYNGVAITGYEQDGDAIDVVLDEAFDINKLTYTLSEYAEPTFEYDEETGFLAITVTSKTGSSSEYDFNIYRRGDINNDSQVSIADVTSLVNIILGKQPDYKMLVVDVNGDEGVSIADVTALVNIILGKTN